MASFSSNSNGSNKSQMKQWDEREQRQELSSVTGGRLREDTVTPLILAADPMKRMHTNTESDEPVIRDVVRGIDGKMDGASHTPITADGNAVPRGALGIKRGGNATNHKGGLVHHAVHYPSSHRGGMVHETKRGPRPNSGSVGMISGQASSAGNEDVPSDDDNNGGD